MKNQAKKLVVLTLRLSLMLISALSLISINGAHPIEAHANARIGNLNTCNSLCYHYENNSACDDISHHGPGRQNGYNGNTLNFLSTGCGNWKGYNWDRKNITHEFTYADYASYNSQNFNESYLYDANGVMQIPY